jgi:alkanesulfonate monooxygenase SsuD/methylene tetrahydromethanopterin reductase-like flavin-dependent oxidoreductase (luciferase family)
MRVGVLQFFSWPNREVPLPNVFERAMKRMRTMDQNGYDAVWLAEHHFTGYSICPSVHVMAAHVAGQTRNLRIGTAVTLAPLYHPLRIAEEIALLDVLTEGRINWGAGRGFDKTEFDAFDIPPEESTARMREAVAIVLAAWTQDRVNYQGEFHQVNDVEVLPKPVQAPHPPTWVAASSEGAVRWAAEQGLSILMDPHSPHGEIGRKRRIYEEVLGAHGHEAKGRNLPTARLMALGETDEEAEAIARRGASWTTGTYISKDAIRGFRNDDKEIDPIEHYLNDVVIQGCPERVVDKLLQLETEISLDSLLLSPLSERTFELFTERVLPHVGG